MDGRRNNKKSDGTARRKRRIPHEMPLPSKERRSAGSLIDRHERYDERLKGDTRWAEHHDDRGDQYWGKSDGNVRLGPFSAPCTAPKTPSEHRRDPDADGSGVYINTCMHL